MMYFVWFFLILIAVTDAREHRIPNIYLLAVLLFSSVNKLLFLEPEKLILMSVFSGSVLFFFSLIFHFIKVMAPGDVKLLGVVGYVVGWEDLRITIFFISCSAIIVGSFYAWLHIAGQFKGISSLTHYSLLNNGLKGKRDLSVISLSPLERKAVMPFAPVVVIGLALQQYISHF